MSANPLQEAILESEPSDLARRMVADLNRPSPLIGALGPPDSPGPEEPYIRALEGAPQEVRRKFADGLRAILLEEAAAIANTRPVNRPLLLYNLFALLEAIKLPGAPELLQVLREEEQPLSRALADQGDDLYAQLLVAHAVNQNASPQDLAFWLGLLDHENVDYVSAGAVGLRESGPENALRHLPKVKEAYARHEDLGSFDDEVMLLLDTYPDVNWPLLAQEFVLDQEIRAWIAHHEGDRYKPGIDESEGDAARIIRRAGKTSEVERKWKTWAGSVPALALSGATNGHSRV
jgi:hypothetical protein